MSNYYSIRLRRFNNDTGFTGGERDLRNLNQRVAEGLPPANQEAALNDQSADNRLIKFSGEEVIINVSPTVSETRAANYDDSGLPAPQGIVVYKTTNNRRWSISARFVSRNLKEAEINFLNVNVLKSWLIPQGAGEELGKFGRPPILRLNGYKDQFLNIPVVLSNLTINFPEDVDYLETSRAMVPIIQNVDLELIESHRVSSIILAQSEVSDIDTSTQEFDLTLYKQGILPGY